MTTDKICRNCLHATTEPGNREHYKVGLRNCELRPVWWFCRGGHSCGKWRAKD